jgi:hypothetical protein
MEEEGLHSVILVAELLVKDLRVNFIVKSMVVKNGNTIWKDMMV